MADAPIIDQIMTQLTRLDPAQQRQVLDFTLTLASPIGESGSHLIESLSRYHINEADLAEMQRVIEEDCERVDPDEWDKTVFPD
jgi:hypothetical protein